MPDAVVVRDKTELAQQTSAGDVFSLLKLAIEKGIPVEALEKLQALHERVSDRNAAAEFAAAVAEFQRLCGPINKNKTANIATRGGSAFQYSYADLPEITKTIAPHLEATGLAYTWDSTMADKLLKATCILRHVNGHRESATFSCPVDSGAGMSEQQKYAAALSFARRQSLIQVLGLTTAEAEEHAVDNTPISDIEAARYEKDCDEAGIDKARFLKWLKVKSFGEIPIRRRAEVVGAIIEKQKKNASQP